MDKILYFTDTLLIIIIIKWWDLKRLVGCLSIRVCLWKKSCIVHSHFPSVCSCSWNRKWALSCWCHIVHSDLPSVCSCSQKRRWALLCKSCLVHCDLPSVGSCSQNRRWVWPCWCHIVHSDFLSVCSCSQKSGWALLWRCHIVHSDFPSVCSCSQKRRWALLWRRPRKIRSSRCWLSWSWRRLPNATSASLSPSSTTSWTLTCGSPWAPKVWSAFCSCTPWALRWGDAGYCFKALSSWYQCGWKRI